MKVLSIVILNISSAKKSCPTASYILPKSLASEMVGYCSLESAVD